MSFILFWTQSWWRHQMETFSALLAICAGNSPVTGEFPTQRPVTQSLDVFFDLRINGWVNNHDAGDLRRRRAHYDVTEMICEKSVYHGTLYQKCIGYRDHFAHAPSWWETTLYSNVVPIGWAHTHILHNCHNVSNHQSLDCLIYTLFRLTQKKVLTKAKVRIIHKGSQLRKSFPCHGAPFTNMD